MGAKNKTKNKPHWTVNKNINNFQFNSNRNVVHLTF